MSGLIGGALPQFVLDPPDKRALGWRFQPVSPVPITTHGQAPYDYDTPWWPGGGGLSGSDCCPVPPGVWYDHPDFTRGCNGRFGVVGVTRDAYGSPLGGCTVKIYRTSTDEVQATVVSDSLGNYVATTPYLDAHYLVVYKSGSPDVFGTTSNQLTAA